MVKPPFGSPRPCGFALASRRLANSPGSPVVIYAQPRPGRSAGHCLPTLAMVLRLTAISRRTSVSNSLAPLELPHQREPLRRGRAIGALQQACRWSSLAAVLAVPRGERGAWALFFVIGIRSRGRRFRSHNKLLNVLSNFS